MKWLKRAIRNWLRDDVEAVCSPTVGRAYDQPSGVRFTVHRAVNGIVVEYYDADSSNSPRQGPSMPNMIIVPSGEDIADAIKITLVRLKM